MEFNRLADVEVVETANDTDKVLIEQNGEIKRVPKTEVGGSGGGGLVITADESMQSFTANMTLTETLEAFNKHELGYSVIYATMQGAPILMPVTAIVNGTAQFGIEIMAITATSPDGDLELFWTTDGITTEPPM